MTVTIVILSAVCVLLALFLVVLFATVAELASQVKQLREHLQLDDEPGVLDTQKYNPDQPYQLRTAGMNRLVVFSTSCQSCHKIAPALDPRGLAAQGIAILVTGEPDLERRFVEEYRLASPTTYLDHETGLVDEIGIDTSPAVLSYSRSGQLVEAWTVGSRRELDKIISKEIQDEQDHHESSVIHR
ncbi:MAG: hypothetical protein Q4F67_06370 [Propionibacteriaceae bacterium]|nr:hypothetical protein [Propionibacteriaceae bacterium]